jgi:serine/threonine protein kinase
MADRHLMILPPGTVIAGRYEVVKSLGQGSMGVVYACRHRQLAGHLVSIKVLFPEVAQDKIAAARFRNEICASYGVSHPNVVRAYEYLTDGDLVAYTMEYVSGGDLANRLDREEPIPIHEVISILSQMASGVQAIHDAGIIHRDLKPENILITKDGKVKITDFGIARTDHGPKLTEHGGLVGTLAYVSPEYMLNSQVDWRSDIFAIGILAYEMIVGQTPFEGDSLYATMRNRLTTDPPLPSLQRSECPPELDRVVFKAMHRDPDQRYQSAAEIYEDLRSYFPPRELARLAELDKNKRDLNSLYEESRSSAENLQNLKRDITSSNSIISSASLNGAFSNNGVSSNKNLSTSNDVVVVSEDKKNGSSSDPLLKRDSKNSGLNESNIDVDSEYSNGNLVESTTVISRNELFKQLGSATKSIHNEGTFARNLGSVKNNGFSTEQKKVNFNFNDNGQQGVKIGRVSLDTNGVKLLNQVSKSSVSSPFSESILVALVVMFVVGLGIAVVKLFFPELLFGV